MSEPTQEPSTEQSFETLLEQLEQRVQKLEKGELPLAQALKLFEEGIELTRSCHERLDQADERIAMLVRGPDGAAVASEFES